MPAAVGVPEIVIVLLAHAAVTPVGNPVAVPIPIAPVVVCVILFNTEFIHMVGVEDAALVVLFVVAEQKEKPPQEAAYTILPDA